MLMRELVYRLYSILYIARIMHYHTLVGVSWNRKTGHIGDGLADGAWVTTANILGISSRSRSKQELKHRYSYPPYLISNPHSSRSFPHVPLDLIVAMHAHGHN